MELEPPTCQKGPGEGDQLLSEHWSLSPRTDLSCGDSARPTTSRKRRENARCRSWQRRSCMRNWERIRTCCRSAARTAFWWKTQGWTIWAER
eukprot:3946386-Amphidinium_carterae.1